MERRRTTGHNVRAPKGGCPTTNVRSNEAETVVCAPDWNVPWSNDHRHIAWHSRCFSGAVADLILELFSGGFSSEKSGSIHLTDEHNLFLRRPPFRFLLATTSFHGHYFSRK